MCVFWSLDSLCPRTCVCVCMCARHKRLWKRSVVLSQISKHDSLSSSVNILLHASLSLVRLVQETTMAIIPRLRSVTIRINSTGMPWLRLFWLGYVRLILYSVDMKDKEQAARNLFRWATCYLLSTEHTCSAAVQLPCLGLARTVYIRH